MSAVDAEKSILRKYIFCLAVRVCVNLRGTHLTIVAEAGTLPRNRPESARPMRRLRHTCEAVRLRQEPGRIDSLLVLRGVTL